MFTGIIETLGTITEMRPVAQGKRLSLDADVIWDEIKIGDSISVSGACLTVVSFAGPRFEVDVSPESLGKTTFGRAKVGDRVNLERALRLSDRIGGHLVSGHIDGVGTLKQKKRSGNSIVINIEVPEPFTRYMIEKGSVAVDGISLTINNCDRNSFDVSVIPHTAKTTTLGFCKIGGFVNIETDMIGKYVERFVAKRPYTEQGENTETSVDLQFLEKTGFIR